MGEKRRWMNWDQTNRDDGRRWPPKSPIRWGQQKYSGSSAWRDEEGSTKPVSTGWASSWERTFCSYVCRVPWRKICDAPRVLYIYKNVTEWDDSAGQEAFGNAKARYWAKINHLPCNIPMPDPYMYIDKKVNFDAFIDPNLVDDLERSMFNMDIDKRESTDSQLDSSEHERTAHERTPVVACDREAEQSSSNWDKYVVKPLAARPCGCEAKQSSSNWDKYIEKPAAVSGWDGWGDGFVRCDSWEGKRETQASWKDQDDSWRHQQSWKNERNTSWKYSGGNNWGSDYSFEKVQQQRPWQHGPFWGTRSYQTTTGYSGAPFQRENAVS